MKARGTFRPDFRSRRSPPRCPLDAIARGRRHAGVRLRRAPRFGRVPGARRALSAGVPHAIHYALKANSTLAIVRLLRELGSGADANSVGEIEVALRAGFDPDADRVHRRRQDRRRARARGRARPEDHQRRVAGRAGAHRRASPGRTGPRARVALRVNPDIDARSHPHISTGLTHQQVRRADRAGAGALPRGRARRPGCEPVGVHVHVGSQITTLDPLASAAAARSSTLVARAARRRHRARARGSRRRPRHLLRRRRSVPTLTRLRGRDRGGVSRRPGSPLVLEPGRALVGAAGLLLTRVVDVKEYPGGPRFAVLDAGMTELMRPALYGAFHRIVAVAPRPGEPLPYEVVGPLCESSDIFGRDRLLPPLEVGDLVADARHRRVRRGDGVDLQPAAAAARSARRRRRDVARHPRGGRRSTICWRSKREDASRACMPGLLIAFEGLDQSGKETQAQRLAERLEALGPPRATRLVSRLHDADRPRDRPRAAAASASTRPTSCSCSTSRIATSGSRELTALARGGRHRALRSVCGVEHRVRRDAGARCARGSPTRSGTCRSRPDDPARHRAGDRGGAQGAPAAIATSAIWRCSPACARAIAGRPAPGLGSTRRRAQQGGSGARHPRGRHVSARPASERAAPPSFAVRGIAAAAAP